MDENWCALALAILHPTPLTVEQAFERLLLPRTPLRFDLTPDAGAISDEMVAMRESGMEYRLIGDCYGISTAAAFKRIKRRRDRRQSADDTMDA